MERKPVGVTAPYRPLTPEDEEFNRIERESRIKQESVRNIKLPTREQLVAEVAILTELVKVLSARVDELEGKQ
tara:strand:+ start:137 stop:355 length:219 start_codon:yes stop_codon:yes gene_type:complete